MLKVFNVIRSIIGFPFILIGIILFGIGFLILSKEQRILFLEGVATVMKEKGILSGFNV